MTSMPGGFYDAETASKLVETLGADTICESFSAVVNCKAFLVPFLVSGAVGSLMTGLIISQAYTYTWLYYVRGFKQQGVLILVWVSTVLQMVSTLSDLVRLIDVFGHHFGSFSSFVTPRKTDAISYFANNIAQVITQLFLLYRAWAFAKVKTKSRKAVVAVKWTLGFLLCLIVLSSAASMAVTLEIQKINNFMLLAFRIPQTRIYDVAMPMWLAPSTVVDVTLAAIIFWELYLPKKERSERFTALHNRLFMFLRIVTQSGIVLAALQLGMLCCWQTQLDNRSPAGWTSWVYLPQTILARFYTFTLILICTLPYARKVKTSNSLANIEFNEEGQLSPGEVVRMENQLTRMHMNSKERMKRTARQEMVSLTTSSHRWMGMPEDLDLEQCMEKSDRFLVRAGSAKRPQDDMHDIEIVETARVPLRALRRASSTGNLDGQRTPATPGVQMALLRNHRNASGNQWSPEAAGTYSPSYSYKPSILPNAEASSLSPATSEAERYNTAMATMFPERSRPSKLELQTTSLPAYSAPFSPISNMESLRLYSAVPAIHLSSNTTFASPSPPLTNPVRTFDDGVKTTEDTQEATTSPRAAFFAQVQKSSQEKKQPPTTYTYRFGKDFTSRTPSPNLPTISMASKPAISKKTSFVVGSYDPRSEANRSRIRAPSDVEDGLGAESERGEMESRFSISTSGSRNRSTSTVVGTKES